MIEDYTATTSQKLQDLENKISEATSITDQVTSDLDNIENEQLEAVTNGIEQLKSIKSDLDQAKNNLDETKQLESDARDYMQELEDMEPEDFELENLKLRVEEYKTHNLSDISEKVDTARLHRKDLHQAYLDLLELFSIADDFCEVHDNDNVNCDISKLTQLGPLIQKAWIDANEAKKLLAGIEPGMKEAGTRKNDFTPCDAKKISADDLTSFKNNVDEIKSNLGSIELDNMEEYDPNFDSDAQHIDQAHHDITQLYNEIYGILFNSLKNTSEPAYEQESKDQWGVYGGIEFLKNPGCWFSGEVCNFDVDHSSGAITEDSNGFVDAYSGVIEDAISNAQDEMDGRGRTHDGAANEIDKAKRSFEDLTMKNSDADVIHNNLDDIESTIQEHLIESTRSLLDRVPLSKNAQNFKKSDLVEPHVVPNDFGDSTFHFDMDLNVRLKSKDNNLVYFGNEENFVTVDSQDGYAVAEFNVAGRSFKVRSENDLPTGSDNWYSIHLEKMGRRLAVSAQCHPHESCDTSVSDQTRAERTDQDGRRRRKRRRRRHRQVSLKISY